MKEVKTVVWDVVQFLIDTLTPVVNFLWAPYKDALPVAEIHAGVLAIFIGIMAAYSVYIHEKLDELRTVIFSEAHRVNDIRFRYEFGLPKTEIYVASESKNRKELLKRLKKLAMGLQDPDRLPEDSVRRGKEAVLIMSALSHFYPFAKEAEPIRFDNLEKVQHWLSDVKEVILDVSFISKLDGTELIKIIDSYSGEISLLGLRDMASDFIKNVLLSDDIVRSVKRHLVQFEAYKTSKPERTK